MRVIIKLVCFDLEGCFNDLQLEKIYYIFFQIYLNRIKSYFFSRISAAWSDIGLTDLDQITSARKTARYFLSGEGVNAYTCSARHVCT
jgi:hypothetical protein